MVTNGLQERPAASSKAGGRLSIREEQKQRTRERLLDAAFEVFKEVGFRSATIDEIMKRAGANRATFYLHFHDKIDIAAGLGRRSATRVADRFRLLDNLVSPTREDVRAWLVDDFAEKLKDKVLLHVIQEASASDPAFGQEYLDYFGRIAERVMVNTVARWPEEQRPLARSKIVCLFIMMDRIEFHHLCQNLDFRGCDPLDAVAGILWNELFGCAVAGSGEVAGALKSALPAPHTATSPGADRATDSGVAS
jgi:AcrR family transcriptional regulator